MLIFHFASEQNTRFPFYKYKLFSPINQNPGAVYTAPGLCFFYDL